MERPTAYTEDQATVPPHQGFECRLLPAQHKALEQFAVRSVLRQATAQQLPELAEKYGCLGRRH
jgi:hypothetical protein